MNYEYFKKERKKSINIITRAASKIVASKIVILKILFLFTDLKQALSVT